MSRELELDPQIQVLYDSGLSLREGILKFLGHWPTDSRGTRLEWKDLPAETRTVGDRLVQDTRRWFNQIKIDVLPSLLYEQQFVYYCLRGVEAAIKKKTYRRPYPQRIPTQIKLAERNDAWGSLFSRGSSEIMDIESSVDLEVAISEATEHMETALSLVASVPRGAILHRAAEARMSAEFMANTAFILMWMDRDRPELDDVANTIKEVCTRYGIQARRADDVEHQDRITEVVLEHIRLSEFLIADLTGERPNVYYEVGFAHAIGKRPILYRKVGTELHFDLSVHNVPEYKNLTELRSLLSGRLEAILGKTVGN